MTFTDEDLRTLDACVTPTGPTCGHSACSQNFIDTGDASCVEDFATDAADAQGGAT